ncbi:GerAB/ArcD/ProY family transporter [Aquibacillus halophilus]|uniref:GerAB/ArcD/ProY family transporter n=1 Tax=Aquibacillus halophilus TaxID=930132 RepID=A0A6A8DHA8_9BACI|nr:endospore germination permease [Aquibacillus halophilus]MRH45088.1 GerAB/ArcD/ProY family transporter [Aquibacillus halophilus]
MSEKVRISGAQFAILVIMNVLGTAIIIVPSIAASFGQQNGWFSVLLATLFGIGLVFLYYLIDNNHPNKNLYEQLEDLFGKWIGKFLSVLFIVFFFEIAIGNLRVMGDFIITQILVNTPIEVIMLLAVITCLIAVRMGIEVISRTAEIFFPYTVIAIILLITLVLPESEITHIQPVLQNNIAATLAGVIPLLGYPFLELVVMLAIMKHVNKQKAGRGFLVGMTIGGLLLTVVTLMCLVVLGSDITARNVYPTYVLGKKISVADFLDRIEILVAIIWFFTIFFKITISFYVVAIGVSHTLNLKNYKTTTIPLAYVIMVFGFFASPNIISTRIFLSSTWIPVSLIFGLVIPIVMLVVGFVKKKI